MAIMCSLQAQLGLEIYKLVIWLASLMDDPYVVHFVSLFIPHFFLPESKENTKVHTKQNAKSQYCLEILYLLVLLITMVTFRKSIDVCTY